MGIAGVFSARKKRALWQSSHWGLWAGMAVRFWCVSGFLGYFVVGAGTLVERETLAEKELERGIFGGRAVCRANKDYESQSDVRVKRDLRKDGAFRNLAELYEWYFASQNVTRIVRKNGS